MQKRRNKFGMADTECCMCGELGIMALKIPEQHKGKTEILCRNCHSMQKRENKLGNADQTCCICGESRIMAIEVHHVPGQHKGKTEILCKNHHALITAYQHECHEKLSKIVDERDRERIGYALLLYQSIEYYLTQQTKCGQGLNGKVTGDKETILKLLLLLILAYFCFITLIAL